jgi:integrase/recombinase XerD
MGGEAAPQHDVVQAPEVPPLPLEAEDFLVWLVAEKGRSPNTISAYRRDLTAYGAFLHGRGLTLADVQEDDIARYVAEMQGAGRKPASVKRALVAVRTMHRFLVVEEHLPTDPAADLDPQRVPAGVPKALTEEEAETLLAAVVGDDPVALRDRAMLEVLYGTGVRIGELVGLSLADLDLERGFLRAFGKGSKERLVPVGRLAREATAAYLANGRPGLEPARWARRGDAEAVFLNQRGGRLTRQGAWLVLKAHADRVGLGEKVSPHVLRHSCATHMLDHGADIRIVQELLGHASISTTQVYTRVSAERLWQVYDAAHPRARR